LSFRGHYEHSLDSKDRLTVPARFRAPLADGVVLAKGLDPCVEVWTTDNYASFTDDFLSQANPLTPDGRMVRRFFHGNSYDEKLDSAGRIRIPKHLVEHAELAGACVVIGMADHFEVWNERNWTEQEAQSSARVNEAAAELAKSG
jgi:MraZ protein